ncbi:MAG: hypothetical protein AAF607_05785 [Pseudomonadota bacterium]
MDVSAFLSLPATAPQRHIAILAGPVQSAATPPQPSQPYPGATLVRAVDVTEIADAMLIGLRTAPAVLAVLGDGPFARHVISVMLALQSADVSIPPLLLLSPQRESAAALSLATAGPVMPILETVTGRIERASLATITSALSPLAIDVPGEPRQVGLIFGAGAYAYGLHGNFHGLFNPLDLLRLHLWRRLVRPKGVAAIAASTAQRKAELCRVTVDKHPALSKYLYGALISSLPLPLLRDKHIGDNTPLGFLGVERTHKARRAALRSFRGRLDRSTFEHGVHLTRGQTMSMRLSGPYSLDGDKVKSSGTLSVSATPPLDMIDLRAV